MQSHWARNLWSYNQFLNSRGSNTRCRTLKLRFLLCRKFLGLFRLSRTLCAFLAFLAGCCGLRRCRGRCGGAILAHTARALGGLVHADKKKVQLLQTLQQLAPFPLLFAAVWTPSSPSLPLTTAKLFRGSSAYRPREQHEHRVTRPFAHA